MHLAHLAELTVLSKPCRVEIEGAATDLNPHDRMIEEQWTWQGLVDPVATPDLQQHRPAVDAKRTQNGQQEQRLVLAVAVAALHHEIWLGGPMGTLPHRHGEVSDLGLYELQRSHHPLLGSWLRLEGLDEFMQLPL